jgi:hypothetical protein
VTAFRGSRSIVAFAAGAALLAGVAHAQRERRVGASTPLGFTSVPAFQVSGVRDAPGVATVVVCTNFSFAPMDLSLVVRDFDGAATCTLELPALAAQESATFATRDASLYTEDRICAPAPGTDGGWAVLSAAGRLHALVCTAQVVTWTPNGTVSASRLPLYTAAGALLRDRLFADSFETGDSSRWSAAQTLDAGAFAAVSPSPDPRPWDGCRLPLREPARLGGAPLPAAGP